MYVYLLCRDVLHTCLPCMHGARAWTARTVNSLGSLCPHMPCMLIIVTGSRCASLRHETCACTVLPAMSKGFSCLTVGERLHAKDIVCMLSGRLQGSLFPQQRWRPGLWFARRWTRWNLTSVSQACCHPAFLLRMQFEMLTNAFPESSA